MLFGWPPVRLLMQVHGLVHLQRLVTACLHFLKFQIALANCKRVLDLDIGLNNASRGTKNLCNTVIFA